MNGPPRAWANSNTRAVEEASEGQQRCGSLGRPGDIIRSYVYEPVLQTMGLLAANVTARIGGLSCRMSATTVLDACPVSWLRERPSVNVSQRRTCR